MKSGKTLVELAGEIQRQQREKRDFIAPTTKLKFGAFGERGAIKFINSGEDVITFPTRHCLNQVCQRAGVPMGYADKMLEQDKETKQPVALDLLADNINYWFQKKPETRMLRTLVNSQATARAFLSDRYRPLDNGDLAEVVLPKLLESGCEVRSSEITETRLYIQAATGSMQARIDEIRKAHNWTAGSHQFLDEPQIVQAGAVISNSEVGAGSLRVEPMLFFLRCLNGLILTESIRRYHVGRGHNAYLELENAAEYFSNATRQADDRAFWMKVRDVVGGVFKREKFDELTMRVARTGGVKLDKPSDAVIEVGKRFKLNETEQKGVLDHLIESGDNSLHGLINAVTRTAEDVESYDRAIELERIGGEIVELPNNLWSAN